MSDPKRNQETGRALARKGKLAFAAALVSVLLAACGDGGDSSSAAAPTGSVPPIGSSPPTGSAPLAAVASAKGATTLSWQPPTMNDDGSPLRLKGYRIYWGLTEDNLSHSVTLDNPGLTRYIVEQLTPATWYFVATALSAEGESEPSNVVAMKIL
jgi:hypothetical protein